MTQGVRHVRIPLLISLCAAALLLSCSMLFKPDGRAELTDIIAKQSHGLIRLVSYTKTNGVERDFFGTHLYVVEYEGEIEFLDDVYWTGPRFGWGGRFCAYKREATMNVFGMTMPSIAPPGYVAAKKNEHQTIRGELRYEMTDKGWVAGYSDCSGF